MTIIVTGGAGFIGSNFVYHILQKYKDGGLSDIQFFNEADGFSFNRSGGIGNETNLLTWLGHRGQIGKLVPFGFPKNNKFFN